MPTPNLYRGCGGRDQETMAGAVISVSARVTGSAYRQRLSRKASSLSRGRYWPGTVDDGGGGSWWRLFVGEVGGEVDAGRSQIGVTEPQGDDGRVDPGLQQRHRAAVTQYV